MIIPNYENSGICCPHYPRKSKKKLINNKKEKKKEKCKNFSSSGVVVVVVVFVVGMVSNWKTKKVKISKVVDLGGYNRNEREGNLRLGMGRQRRVGKKTQKYVKHQECVYKQISYYYYYCCCYYYLWIRCSCFFSFLVWVPFGSLVSSDETLSLWSPAGQKDLQNEFLFLYVQSNFLPCRLFACKFWWQGS